MKDGMHLDPIGVWLIGIFYAILSIAFGYSTFTCLARAEAAEVANLTDALVASASTSLCVSSLFYLRKLYRDVFAGLSKTKEDEKEVSVGATAIYFLSRPIFAVAISALFTILIFAAVRQFSEGHVGINTDFVFFAAISSFMLSIATGAGILRLEELANSGHSFFRIPM